MIRSALVNDPGVGLERLEAKRSVRWFWVDTGSEAVKAQAMMASWGERIRPYGKGIRSEDVPGCRDQLDGGQESKMSDRKMVPLSPISTLSFLLSNKSSTWSWTSCHPEYAISQPPLQLDVVMYLSSGY